MTYARPVPRRFEMNAAALPAVGDAGEDADTLYSPTAPLPRPTAWVTGGGALTYQSPPRRSEPLRPSELPAVGAAGEDAATSATGGARRRSRRRRTRCRKSWDMRCWRMVSIEWGG